MSHLIYMGNEEKQKQVLNFKIICKLLAVAVNPNNINKVRLCTRPVYLFVNSLPLYVREFHFISVSFLMFSKFL